MIKAFSIGSYVHIGKNVVLEEGCFINFCCLIMPNSVVVENTRVPPYSIFSGNPAKRIGDLPPSTIQMMIEATTRYYELYLLTPEKKELKNEEKKNLTEDEKKTNDYVKKLMNFFDK